MHSISCSYRHWNWPYSPYNTGNRLVGGIFLLITEHYHILVSRRYLKMSLYIDVYRTVLRSIIRPSVLDSSYQQTIPYGRRSAAGQNCLPADSLYMLLVPGCGCGCHTSYWQRTSLLLAQLNNDLYTWMCWCPYNLEVQSLSFQSWIVCDFQHIDSIYSRWNVAFLLYHRYSIRYFISCMDEIGLRPLINTIKQTKGFGK